MSKPLRARYIALHPEIKEYRAAIGRERFDYMYDCLYAFLSKMNTGDWFVVGDVLKNDPSNKPLVLLMCDLYNHMDSRINLAYNQDTESFTLLPPINHNLSCIHPPNVFKSIRNHPECWGVNASNL